MFDNLEQYFNSLNFNAPGQGYYPDPTKSILIVYPKNIRLGGLFGVSHGLGCEREHVISVVISWMTNPNVGRS